MIVEAVSNDPFGVHREAFRHEAVDNIATSAELFAQALGSFAALLGESRFKATVMDRAACIPGSRPEDSKAIAEAFLDELPSWLIDLHFERLSRALSEVQLHVARTHWGLIEYAAQFPTLRQAADLDLLRDRLCQRFLDEALLQAGSHERLVVVRVAERLLQVDPANATARLFALKGYLLDIQLGLDRLARIRSRGQDLLSREQMRPHAAQRLRVGLRREARRLRRHSTVLSRVAQRSLPEFTDGYLTLCRYYWSVNEYEMAVRMARRARRLSPADARIRGLLKDIRRMRRQR